MFDKTWLITQLFYGFYNLIGRVFDCDSKNIGSIPIKNPVLLLF